jgi:hypothetical protein
MSETNNKIAVSRNNVGLEEITPPELGCDARGGAMKGRERECTD